MSQRRTVVAVSVKPKCFKLEPRHGSSSSSSPPPSSPDENTSEMPSIKLSKNWELPQRLKPGRKPKYKRAEALANKKPSFKLKKAPTCNQKGQMITADCEHELTKDDGDKEVNTIASGDENGVDNVEKRRKQNRDAQRAYRERRTTRIQVLEDKVEKLQNLVDTWHKKYKLLEFELRDTKKKLHSSLALNSELQRTSPWFTNTQFQQPQSNAQNLAENPVSITEMIENFKPMGAVNLKKRKADEAPLTSQISTISTDQSLSEIETVNEYQYPSSKQFSSRNSSLDGHTSPPSSLCSSSTNANKKTKFCEKKQMVEPTECCGQDNTIAPTLAPGCFASKKIKLDGKRPVPTCCKDKERDKEIDDSENKPITIEDGSWIPGSCKQCRSDPNSMNFCQSLSNRRSSSCCSASSSVPANANKQQTDMNYSLIKLPEIGNAKNTPSDVASNANDYIPISCTYQKIRQHMQKNKSLQEPINTDDPASVSLILENVASGLRVSGQKVELQSVKDALHKMDKHVLE
ncbi:YAP7-like protein [Saccharomyces eubayanus]|uniref:YAP7-like protein n=1 Tax=Saccharomyces eubayanus TaxID=1080349 RepID=UPI0006C37B9E|nr:YAP7-like protein [Saccharomyces eubayanus]KOG99039.1 YAP7-like protein [Saccharomyces eubayanus]